MKKVAVVVWAIFVGMNLQASGSHFDFNRNYKEIERIAQRNNWKVTYDKNGDRYNSEFMVEISPKERIFFGTANSFETVSQLRELEKLGLQQSYSSFSTVSKVDSPVVQAKSLNDVGINANPDWNLEKALVDTKRPNESWSKKQLQEFIEEKSDRLKIIHRDQPDEKTEVGINGNTVWNNELSSFGDYLLCAQRLYDALGFLTK